MGGSQKRDVKSLGQMTTKRYIEQQNSLLDRAKNAQSLTDLNQVKHEYCQLTVEAIDSNIALRWHKRFFQKRSKELMGSDTFRIRKSS